MIDEELRNLAAEVAGNEHCPRAWHLKVADILRDLAEDVAHLQSQPVPQHMRRPALVGMYRPALSVVVGGKA